MRYVSIPVVTVFIVLLSTVITPLILSAKQKAELAVTEDNCVCYSRALIKILRVFAVFFILLTIVVLVLTILSIADPEMMETDSDDIVFIVLSWLLCIMADIATITPSILLTRKIYYDNKYFTEIKPFNKKKRYFYSDVTRIENTVIVELGEQSVRKGKLKIYFGNECVKVSAYMYGVKNFIKVLHAKCKNIKFN